MRIKSYGMYIWPVCLESDEQAESPTDTDVEGGKQLYYQGFTHCWLCCETAANISVQINVSICKVTTWNVTRYILDTKWASSWVVFQQWGVVRVWIESGWEGGHLFSLPHAFSYCGTTRWKIHRLEVGCCTEWKSIMHFILGEKSFGECPPRRVHSMHLHCWRRLPLLFC